MNGLLVDLFAGGGGASTGIEAALGRPVDIAINHDPVALAVHRSNHPRTTHLATSVWDVDPVVATGGRPVELLWASPDCTHFSVAKGGKPRKKKIRSLAWVVVRWVKAVRPAEIYLENVREFQTWGPLGKDDRPIKAQMGRTFRAWRRKLERYGYRVEHRVLDASEYGAPTRRRRLFLIALVNDGPIAWPEPTHGQGRQPFRTAGECIDWSLPCPSIFERDRPLAEKTLWRIAQGLKRFVLTSPTPYVIGVGGRAGDSAPTSARDPLGTITAKNDRAVVAPVMLKVNHGKAEPRGEDIGAPLSTVTATQRGHALAAATLIQTGYGERPGQAARALDIEQPLGTVVAGGVKAAAVAAFLTKFRGTNHSASLADPAPTVTASGTHLAEVRAFLVSYYATQQRPDLAAPLPTITTRDRLGLVTIHGTEYQIVDIGMRMLEPHELLRAQFGRFAAGYDMSEAKGKKGKVSKTVMVRLIGNSVCPEMAEALIRSQRDHRNEQLEFAA